MLLTKQFARKSKLIAALTERQRQVVTLCILQEQSHAEAARRLCLKEASVKTYLKSARKNLKKQALLEPSEGVTA
ncbi:RNA polymerase sigma factor [Streptomyces smyrnaeus]|uniref:RNA polymerase sigma factor n=1 Tax=Streptomyces smyrnaeus TaxID=1387713 RepID=UPI0037AAB44C